MIEGAPQTIVIGVPSSYAGKGMKSIFNFHAMLEFGIKIVTYLLDDAISKKSFGPILLLRWHLKGLRLTNWGDVAILVVFTDGPEMVLAETNHETV